VHRFGSVTSNQSLRVASTTALASTSQLPPALTARQIDHVPVVCYTDTGRFRPTTKLARLIAPLSKLATAKTLDPITAASSLGEMLGLGPVDEDELYAAL
jgi:hypothetical protein